MEEKKPGIDDINKGSVKKYVVPSWHPQNRPGDNPELIIPVTTSDLFKGEPINPWVNVLEPQGVQLKLPDRYKEVTDIPLDTHLDPLTGLPIESDGMRNQTIKKFTKTIREGKNWAVLYWDIDNLKTANSRYDRQFGDIVIRDGTYRGLNFVENLNLPEYTEIIALRQTGAADETIIVLLDINEDKIEEIKTRLPEAENKLVTKEPNFTFSSTFSVVSSRDENIQTELRGVKTYLDENPYALAYDAYNNVKAIADQEVKLKKIAKDMERLPKDRLTMAQSLAEAKKIIIEDLGDSRISERLLDCVLEISGFEETMRWFQTYDSFDEFKERALKGGHTEEFLKHFSTENPRVSYYNTLIQ